MDAERSPIARIQGIDLCVVDRVLAVLLTVGALVDASSQPHQALDALAIVSLVLLTGSVAWRRVNPVRTTAVAVTGLAAFAAASRYSGDGALEVAAIALNFYTLGRRGEDGESVLILVLLFGYWLAGAVVITYAPGGGTIGSALGPWALFGPVPFAVGRTLATRSALTRELQAATARLGAEQEVRARGAAAEERNQMARELHDVIAHSVSVMVIQTSGARRRLAAGDLDVAREALRVVEGAGREALVELRRIVGVLRRGSDELAGSAAPGLSRLGALLDRSRAAGLTVELRVDGLPRTLSPGLDLVAYRVVQEALTNTIKHAGPARAWVNVSVGARELELKVSDTGRGPAPERDGEGGLGHGLVGMGERVRLYGGELRAGRRAGGGFEVRARIPLDGITSSPHVLDSPATGASAMVEAGGVLRWPWLDPLLAGVLLVVFEISLLASTHRRGPLLVNMIVVAGIALAAIWRRRSPLLFLIMVGALAAVMHKYLISTKNSPLIEAYFLLVPAYTVAAWADRRKAVLGLVLFAGGAAVNELGGHAGTVGTLAGSTFLFSAAWAAGRAIRARRVLNSELERASARLAGEREYRARLAVAGERSRIARELHAVVARSVAAMVVQAEAARNVLRRDSRQADAAMSAIENTGRQALAEMRRILGVLRRRDDSGELAPQPGVDQIYKLIERAREGGQTVKLSVDGDPGTIPAGVDLGLYRILEDALQSARQQQGSAVGVSLRFGEENLELHLTARCHGPSGWPTSAMRERVTLCRGQLDPEPDDDDCWRFSARMPRGLQGALA